MDRVSNAGRDPGKRCQVCHRYRYDVTREEGYGPAVGLCRECAERFDRERASRHIKILGWSLCGQELTAGDARAVGIALAETARERLKCCKRPPKEPSGSGRARYSRGSKSCPAPVIGWSQGRFYCARHYPPIE